MARHNSEQREYKITKMFEDYRRGKLSIVTLEKRIKKYVVMLE